MNRHHARELAMKVLFQWDLVRGNPADALAYLAEEDAMPKDVRAFAQQLVEGVLEKCSELDEQIRKYTRDWRFERLATVDRAILRLAIYEILHIKAVPVRVSINEAVELGKAFGSDESSRFINGLLGQLVRDGLPEEVMAEKDLR